MQYNRIIKALQGKRSEQQDSVFCYEGEAFLSATVCDGMGGLSRGADASQTAVKAMDRLLRQVEGEIQDVPEFLLNCVDLLDSSVRKLPREEHERIGTTLVTAVFQNDQLYWLSVGDSRLYILRQGEMVQATRDHNFQFTLDQLRAEHRISSEQYESESAKGGALTSYIGMGNIEFMDICQSPFFVQPGDVFLLTTDGLYKAMPDELICQIIRNSPSIQSAADTFEQQIQELDHPGQDNTSFILVQAVQEEQTVQIPHTEAEAEAEQRESEA